MKLNKSELFSKVFINVLLFSIFIGMFFFTYGAMIEKSVLSSQMNILTANITDTTKLFGYNVNNSLLNYINTIVLPDLSEEDESVNNNNKKIITKVININVIFFIVVSFIIYFVYKKSNKSYDLGEIISNNLVILFFIAITEYSFLTYFGSKFISIDTNQSKLSILKAIDKYYY
jgi:hypothetical protein